MCGISGFNWTDKELIGRMCNVLSHRGPDGEGTYTDGKVSLGHTRLSIIDLSEKGKQPMCNENGKIWITYNGEVYNFQELKEELISRGHDFKSKTDTEVIIHGYEEWGVNILNKLDGMFAFCIYDKNENKLFLARDPLGIKPLYYYFREGKFIFSSEIKAILQHNISRIPNNEAIIEYLTFRSALNEKTFFKNIFLLSAGNYMIFENNELKKVRYWKEEYKYKRAGDYINTFLSLFEDSVKRHLISDVPVGAYTSSGFDSSSIAFFASKYNKNMHIFTGRFRESGFYDEETCVKELAKKINVQQHAVLITPDELMKDIEKIIYHLDEPRSGIAVLSNFYVAKHASKYVKVVLTGHGGDELFLGYPVYASFLLKELMKKNPFILAKSLLKLKGEEFLRFAYFLGYPLLVDKDAGYGHFIIFNKKQRKKILSEDFYNQIKDFNPVTTFKEVIDEDIDSLTRVQQIYFRTFLPTELVVEDKMSMANSIEGRVPICQKDLVNFAFSIDPSIRLKNMGLKSIIKEAMRDKLPDIFYKQEKRGFPTPLSIWLRNELKEYIYDILLNKRARNRELFNIKEVKKLLDKHCNRRSDYLLDRVNAARIWSLLSVELWFKIFIDSN